MNACRQRVKDRSPRAYRCFRQLVEASNNEQQQRPEFDLTEAIMTWWRVPALEAYIFEIDEALANALMWAHVRYVDMIGQTDMEFEEFREEERAAFPELFKGECCYSMDAAIAFMATACDLPYTQAIAWVCRAQIQNIRSRLFKPDSPAPPWAYKLRCTTMKNLDS